MKKIRQITIGITMILASVLLVMACSKDDGGSPQSFADFEFSGIFTGTLYSAGTTSNLEGYVTIEDNGKTTLDLLTGRMKGTSVKVGDSYHITINNVSGLFEDVTDITGTIDVITRTLYLSGTNVDGSPMTVGGEAEEVHVETTGGWENLTKSAVCFTHNENCKASITINGVTLGGLNAHYHNGGLCDNYYDLHNTLRFNLDALQSEVLCSTGTIRGLDGNPITFTDCSTIRFILDKNTHYTYTVNWENGETSTGEFNSMDGGYQLPICISNNGPSCDDDDLVGSAGSPRFNLQFSGDVDMDLYVRTPNGSIISYSNTTAQGGELDVDCACSSSGCNGENIFWTNGPSGQYEYYVNYYGSCGSSSPNASFTVKVLNGNNVVETRTGTLSEGQTSTHWTYNRN